jgi:hypothetical protein
MIRAYDLLKASNSLTRLYKFHQEHTFFIRTGEWLTPIIEFMLAHRKHAMREKMLFLKATFHL